MARPKRIDLPFSLYHVLSRTNSGDIAFKDVWDERKFLFYLEKYLSLFSFRIHAWCMMPTHFHLLLESDHNPALSEFMRRLLTAYTVYFNRRHKRHGHLFQGRFKSYLVDKTDYLLSLSRYIHLNPAQKKTTKDITQYHGSSLRYFVHGNEPSYLYTRETLHYFKGDRKSYAGFILEGLNEHTKPTILQQAFVGDEDFVRRIRKRLGYLKERGSRAQRALVKQKRTILESEIQKAQEILKHVAKHFQTTPGMIKNSIGGKGELGKARFVTLYLLRQHLPWTCKFITEFMGLKGKRQMDYYINRIFLNKTLKNIVDQIGKKLGFL